MLTTQQDSDDTEPEDTTLSTDLDSANGASRSTWSEEKESKFLELWQQHDCLYNMLADRFYDRAEKERKWAEIATVLELPGKCLFRLLCVAINVESEIDSFFITLSIDMWIISQWIHFFGKILKKPHCKAQGRRLHRGAYDMHMTCKERSPAGIRLRLCGKGLYK